MAQTAEVLVIFQVPISSLKPEAQTLQVLREGDTKGISVFLCLSKFSKTKCLKFSDHNLQTF